MTDFHPLQVFDINLRHATMQAQLSWSKPHSKPLRIPITMCAALFSGCSEYKVLSLLDSELCMNVSVLSRQENGCYFKKKSLFLGPLKAERLPLPQAFNFSFLSGNNDYILEFSFHSKVEVGFSTEC